VPIERVREAYDQLAKTVPPTGPLDGFDITRRIGLDHDLVHGRVPIPAEHLGATWLR
jgi:hypothetical protein